MMKVIVKALMNADIYSFNTQFSNLLASEISIRIPSFTTEGRVVRT